VVSLLDELSPGARAIGAVNTVVVRDGRLIGYNTDTTGFARAITDLVHDPAQSRVAVIGAGGVGKAIAFALAVTGVSEIRIFDTDRAKEMLTQGVQRGDRQVTLPVVHPQAAVKSSAFSLVILVRTGENRLYLYKDGQVARSYAVATGRPQFPTPTGQFKVVGKLVNPTWRNPHSDWSASMPETIGPGPSNPLGTHALALSASGILIHETPDVGSIGSNASHGCIRMRGGDEIDLFGQVPTGTTVVIVNAGTPKPRTATPAPPRWLRRQRRGGRGGPGPDSARARTGAGGRRCWDGGSAGRPRPRPCCPPSAGRPRAARW